VGGGACGMMTALRAAEAGAPSVAIFEKSTRQGCNTQFSSASLAAGGTRWQAEAGIDDSPQRHAADILSVSGDRSSADIVDALCAAAPCYVEWFADCLGHPVELGADMPRAGQSVPRLHTDRGRQGGGRLVELLRGAVERSERIAFVDNTPATGLVESRSSVTGITVAEQGGTRHVGAGSVVLAADGFGANQEMLAAYCPDAVGRVYGGVSTSTGDAISWGIGAGAAVSNMTAFLGHGLMVPSTGTRLNPALPFLGGVLVDSSGKRFVDESAQGYSKLGSIVLRQTGGRALMIWDRQAMEAAMNSELMRESKGAGAFRSFDDVQALATAMSMDHATVAASVGGELSESALGPPLRALEGPLFAAWVTGGILTTQGGLTVDPHGRVLLASGGALPGLFAGGGSAAGISGPSCDGYSSGNGLLSAFGFGWIIGAQLGPHR